MKKKYMFFLALLLFPLTFKGEVIVSVPFKTQVKLFFESKFYNSHNKHNKKLLLNRINNPFNIRYSASNEWKGQTGQKNGFCTFSSMNYGIRAGAAVLNNGYFNKGYNTIKEIITKYAPSSENNTDAYIKYVSTRTGIKPDDVIIPVKETLALMCMAITEQENGKNEGRSYDEILNVLTLYKYSIKTTGTID